jgi:hypothetical protein
LDGPPDHVVVWAAQLAANDFPPVCVMSGAQAQVWRKFRFRTRPNWTYWLLALGVLPFFIVTSLVAREASGRLPLTGASRQKLQVVEWTSLGLLPPMLVLLVVGATMISVSVDQPGWAIGIAVLVLGFLCLLGFIVGLLVVRPRIGPRAFVMARATGYHDNLVELRHVHPAFVAAVNQMYAARAAHYAALQTEPGVPTLPEST